MAVEHQNVTEQITTTPIRTIQVESPAAGSSMAWDMQAWEQYKKFKAMRDAAPPQEPVQHIYYPPQRSLEDWPQNIGETVQISLTRLVFTIGTILTIAAIIALIIFILVQAQASATTAPDLLSPLSF